MEYKRKKVNIIIVTLILIISLVTILSTANFIEEVEQTQTVDVMADNDGTTEEEKQVETTKEQEVVLTKAPTFSSGWAALNYAFNILHNNDYVLTGSAVGKNDSVPVVGVITQYVREKAYKVGNEYFFVDVATCDSPFGANYTKYVYNDGTNIISKYEGQSATTVSVEDFVKKNGQAPDFLYYDLNSKTCTMDSFKIAGASYVVKVTLNTSVPGVFDNMEKALKNSPKAMEVAKGISATFEFKINRKTGAFESIKVNERYYIGLNSTLKSTVSTNTTFTFTWKTTDLTELKNKLK